MIGLTLKYDMQRPKDQFRKEAVRNYTASSSARSLKVNQKYRRLVTKRPIPTSVKEARGNEESGKLYVQSGKAVNYSIAYGCESCTLNTELTHYSWNGGACIERSFHYQW